MGISSTSKAKMSSSSSSSRSNILDASASWESWKRRIQRGREEAGCLRTCEPEYREAVLRSHGKGNKGKGRDMATLQLAASRSSAGRTLDSKAVEDKVRHFRQRMQTRKNGSGFKGGREWSPLVSRENPGGQRRWGGHRKTERAWKEQGGQPVTPTIHANLFDLVATDEGDMEFQTSGGLSPSAVRRQFGLYLSTLRASRLRLAADGGPPRQDRLFTRSRAMAMEFSEWNPLPSFEELHHVNAIVASMSYKVHVLMAKALSKQQRFIQKSMRTYPYVMQRIDDRDGEEGPEDCAEDNSDAASGFVGLHGQPLHRFKFFLVSLQV